MRARSGSQPRLRAMRNSDIRYHAVGASDEHAAPVANATTAKLWLAMHAKTDVADDATSGTTESVLDKTANADGAVAGDANTEVADEANVGTAESVVGEAEDEDAANVGTSNL